MKGNLIYKVTIIVLIFTGLGFAQTLHKSQKQILEDSPFAISAFGIPSRVSKVLKITTPSQLARYIEARTIPYMKALGIKWARLHPNIYGTFGWSGVDPDHDGKNLDFSKQDTLVKIAQENNIHLVAGISPTPLEAEWLTAQTYIPENKEAYSSYVRQLVERYDGDGKDDMPNLKYPIKYWQLDNEPDLHYAVRSRRGNTAFCSPREYLEVLKLTYNAIKEADKEAKVMINVAGIGQNMDKTSVDYLNQLNSSGVKDYYDIFSYHIYPDTYDTIILKKSLGEFKRLVGNKPIWITESGIVSKPLRYLPDASEEKQACWVIKHYIFHLAKGVKRIAWLSLRDKNPQLREGIAKYAGFLTFRPPKPKLSYYTYKRMVEILEGADWNNIQTISEKDGVYIYRFKKNNRVIWVAWNERKESKRVKITLDKGIKKVKISEAVPSGEVVSGIRRFKEIEGKILTTHPLQVEFEIGEVPVFVEGTRYQ